MSKDKSHFLSRVLKKKDQPKIEEYKKEKVK